VLFNFGARNNVAPAQDEVFQEHEFACCEIDRLAFTPHHARGRVDLELADLDLRIFSLVTAPTERLYASQQFFKGKWFDQLIIGAGL
jgi:hypothetical protein